MDTLARARAYLLKSQLPDGSWGSGDPFACARALYALRDGLPGEALIRGLRYMEGCQAQDGRFVPRTKMYSDASSTAYSLIALNRFDYGKASLPISRGILWLLENQGEDGSWGSSIKKKAYTTTLCLRALHTFYLSGLNRFARGLRFSMDYVESPDFWAEPVSHVYAPVLNLKHIGYLDETIEKKFMGYVRIAAKGSMDNGSIADAAYLLGTLRVLGDAEVSPALEGWLTTAQNDDGGFGKDLASPSEANWTALAVLSMSGRL